MNKRLLLLGCVGMVGCFETAPASPVTWQSDRVELGTDLVSEVCAGTLELLDRDVESIELALDLERSSQRIPFWIVPDLSEYCSPTAHACYKHGTVYSSSGSFRGSHRHELVHARLGQIRPSVKPFFEEGIATELGGDVGGCRGIPACASADLDELLAASDSVTLGPIGYFAGADVVAGILRVEGAGSLLAFTNQVARDATPEEVRSLYAEHFDATLEQDFELYMRGPLDDYTPAALDCDAPPAPRTKNGGVILEAEMRCDSPMVVNDFDAAAKGDPERGYVEWSFVVEPEESGAVVLTGATKQVADLRLQRCTGVAQVGQTNEFGPWTAGTTLAADEPGAAPLLLGPGLHKLTWKGSLDVGAALDVVLEPPCTFEEQDCPAGQQCTIWNMCEAEVEQPAALGEACDESTQLRACEAGSRCIAGTCVAECDASLPCPDGQGCARIRVCGPACDLLAQDCEPGFGCLPSADPVAVQAGQGQCVPAGSTDLFGGCDTRGAACRDGLSCEVSLLCNSTEGFDGCCLPYCDPTLADPGCPSPASTCDPVLDGEVGICDY